MNKMVFESIRFAYEDWRNPSKNMTLEERLVVLESRFSKKNLIIWERRWKGVDESMVSAICEKRRAELSLFIIMSCILAVPVIMSIFFASNELAGMLATTFSCGSIIAILGLIRDFLIYGQVETVSDLKFCAYRLLGPAGKKRFAKAGSSMLPVAYLICVLPVAEMAEFDKDNDDDAFLLAYFFVLRLVIGMFSIMMILAYVRSPSNFAILKHNSKYSDIV